MQLCSRIVRIFSNFLHHIILQQMHALNTGCVNEPLRSAQNMWSVVKFLNSLRLLLVLAFALNVRSFGNNLGWTEAF